MGSEMCVRDSDDSGGGCGDDGCDDDGGGDGGDDGGGGDDDGCGGGRCGDDGGCGDYGGGGGVSYSLIRVIFRLTLNIFQTHQCQEDVVKNIHKPKSITL